MIKMHKLPQGRIVIAFSDKKFSTGLLYLDESQALEKHNRPVEEELVQISGIGIIKLFDGEKIVKEVILHEDERFVIPANQYHIHSSPKENTSITMWRFDGDITRIIEDIRNKYQEIL